MTTALALEEIAARRGGRMVIESVSMRIEPGECVVLAGESGSGKTSLLRMIAGFDRPERGLIRVGDHVVDDAAGRFVPPGRRGLAMVFQDFALWPHLSAIENVELVIRERRGREERALRLLETLGVGACAARLPSMLSGGQQQRVGLARALAAAPRLLLLDEPFSSLDVETRDALRMELRALIVESGLTALCVSHDPVDGRRLGDRIAILEDGRITQCGPPEALFASPANGYAARIAGHAGGVPVATRRAGADMLVRLAGHDLILQGAAAQAGEADRVLLFWRPDAITLPGSDFPATCIEVSFDAGRWQALVRVEGIAAPIPISCETPPPRGAVSLDIDTAGLHLVPVRAER